jgi:hypothetical protein
MHAHVGFRAHGEIHMEFADGCILEYRAPQVFWIEPCHDGWVVGNELRLVRRLPERHQVPRSTWSRGLLPKNVEVAIVGADFEEGAIGAVPLVDNFLDRIRMPVQ